MIHSPMLARDEVEEDAYCDGYAAMVEFAEAGKGSRLGLLMALRRAARHDPMAAYHLGNLMNEAKGAGPARPRRARTAASLFERAVAMAKRRMEDPDATGWDPREDGVRRIASMAVTNLGNAKQYGLHDREGAYLDYLAGTKIWNRNPVAHLNVGQMNWYGLISAPDGEAALAHYEAAVALGRTCRTLTPGCECLVEASNALRTVPAGRRTSELPRIRDELAAGGTGVAMPQPTSLDLGTADHVEAIVLRAVDDLTPTSPIVARVARIASLAASFALTIAGIRGAPTGGPAAGEEALLAARRAVDGMGRAQAPAGRMLMPLSRRAEAADARECRSFVLSPDLLVLIERTQTCWDELMAMLPARDQEAGLNHALSTILSLASPAWRQGILSTAAAGVLDEEQSGFVRAALPTEIGRRDPVEEMRRWAADPSSM